jgi:hypothetical protein
MKCVLGRMIKASLERGLDHPLFLFEVIYSEKEEPLYKRMEEKGRTFN